MTTATLDTIRDRLQRVNQEHLLGFIDELSQAEAADFLGQIGSIDLEKIPALVDEYVMSAGEFRAAGVLEPAPFYPRDHGSADLGWDRDAMKRAGEALIAAGRVGCFTVAGGQGSRL